MSNPSNKALPYLTSLRGSIAALASGSASSFGTLAQGGITARLVDYMFVQETVAKQLKSTCYESIAKLLPDAVAVLGSSGEIQELQKLCAANDPSAFDRFLELSSKMQSALMAKNDEASNTICKRVASIETRYCHDLEAAVDAQVVASEKANQGGAAIRNTRSYDEQELLAFIRQHYPDETELGIEKSGFISGGTSKFTMLITLKNNKTLPTEIVLRGDAAGTFGGAPVSYEYRLIKAVYEHGGCVAKPLALEESGKVFGSPFMLVEKRGGASIGHMQNLPKQSNPALNDDIAAKLAALHRIPVSAFGNWINSADRPTSAKAIEWIDEGLRNWLPLEMPSTVFSTAFEWLRRHADINDRAPRTLVHGDYGLNNLLVEGNRITAILDWEFAHLGNPAYDLGYYRCMAEPLSSWEHFLECYGKAGVPIPDEDQLNYATLFASTRLGVMTCQVARAFTSGKETGLVGAMVVGGNYSDMMINRIGVALDRVL